MSKPSNPESVRVKVNRPDPLAFRGAAFALTETAFVLLGPGAGEAALWPRDGGGGKLAAQFNWVRGAGSALENPARRSSGKSRGLGVGGGGGRGRGPRDFPRLPGKTPRESPRWSTRAAPPPPIRWGSAAIGTRTGAAKVKVNRAAPSFVSQGS